MYLCSFGLDARVGGGGERVQLFQHQVEVGVDIRYVRAKESLNDKQRTLERWREECRCDGMDLS